MMQNCGAAQYSDQMFCRKCGACWDMNDEDPPECLALSREFTLFYFPVITLAAGAAWLMSPTLAAVVLVVLYYLAEADAAQRGAL